MARKNAGPYGSVGTPQAMGAKYRPFGFAGDRPATGGQMAPQTQPGAPYGPGTGIGAPRAGLDTSQPARAPIIAPDPYSSTTQSDILGGPSPGVGNPNIMQSLMGASGEPSGGQFARDGNIAIQQEYEAAQQQGPQAMELFRARNPGWTPAGGGMVSEPAQMGILQLLAQQARPNTQFQFDASGNIVPGTWGGF